MTGIPSVAFPVRDDELPVQAEACWDVAQLAQRKIDEGSARQTAFENLWQRTILERARAICAARALDYLFTELSVLAESEINEALTDLQRLRTTFLSDISMFCRLGLRDDNPLRNLSEQAMFESARRAESRRDAVDHEYRTLAEAFFSFLASQQELLEEASAAGMRVVHAQFHG